MTIVLVLSCRQSVCVAAELGSPAPGFSLTSLVGGTVSPAPPPGDTLLILYFFNSSEQATGALVRLSDVVSKSSGALSLLAIARGNPEKLKASLAGQSGLYPLVLSDNKGVTLAYGFRGKLPAAVILGPGARIGAILAPAPSVEEISMSSADAFFSLQLPGPAGRVYGAMPEDAFQRARIELGKGFALMLTDNETAARSKFKSLTGGSSPISLEAHAALGFLEFRLGRNTASLAACMRARGSGFAEYVMGMTNARAGQCREASTRFNNATKSRFTSKWQKALALNMAARIAEEQGDDQRALSLYRSAAASAPLNPTINANLLTYHRSHGNLPAASRYAEIIRSINPKDPLITALIGEFEAEAAFRSDAVARKRLEKKVNANLKRDAPSNLARTSQPLATLVSDLTITDCPFELSSLQSAIVGLLRQSLEDDGPFITVPHHEMLAAARQLRISRDGLRKPAHLLKVAKAFSADLVTTGELGTYEGRCFINVRVAEVASGKVIAVASERFGSLEELAPAIKKSAARLKEKVTARYGR